jgi:type IV pilus assembly protein PilP
VSARLADQRITGTGMSNLRLSVSVAALALACALPASAQPAAKPQGSSQPASPAAPAATSGAPAAPPPVEQAPYTYDPLGRRDPFVSLLARGSDTRGASTRAAGLPGVLIAEASVKGIVRDRSGFIAMIQGTGTKTFIVRAGEKLMDGSVKAIAADSVVFLQDVNDPLSMVKQKEVRKPVRSADGGRE